MRRLLTILCLVLMSLCAMAQSDYISNSRLDSLDNFGSLDGRRGIIILSKSNNLVINVSNVPDAEITPKGIDAKGYYEYEVVVGADDTEPKVEVSIRGDVNITSFVASPKKNFFVAYLIELVATPIDLQDQTKGGAILDATKCEVDFTSNFSNLHIGVSPLLGAKVSTTSVKGQDGVYETKVIIPITTLQQAKQKMVDAKAAFDSHTNSLNSQSTDEDFSKDDELKAESEKAAEDYSAMTVLYISGDGTNSLSVPISEMSPREKKTYAVILLNKVKKEYVTECSAHMAEAGRLFGLREYASAKKEFQNALYAKDTPKNLMNTIALQMSQCDSCDTYQKLAIASLLKIRDMRNNGTANQNDVAKYASAAVEFLRIASKYNPCSYYTERIAKLDKMVENLPMDFRITVMQWIRELSGFHEGAPLANVEVWGYYGDNPIVGKSYANDRRFKKLTENSANFKRLGITDENGVVSLELIRKELPKVIFFRPVGYDDKISIEPKDMAELMQKSSGDFMVRQFRMKMYVDK